MEINNENQKRKETNDLIFLMLLGKPINLKKRTFLDDCALMLVDSEKRRKKYYFYSFAVVTCLG